MAISEENLRSPASWRPSRFVITRSCGSSMPLFMQVGVVRTRFSSRRTEMLPSQATMNPRSYIHLPAVQISRRCCSSLFSWVGQSELVDKRALLPGPEFSPGHFSAPSKVNFLGSVRPETRGALYHTRRRFRAILVHCPRGRSRAYTQRCDCSLCVFPRNGRL